MFRSWPIAFAVIVAVLAGAMGANAAVNQPEKSTGVVAPTPAIDQAEREKKLAEATERARELLLLMDTNKSGRVSKQEWMKFMESEFDRLDVNHNGELDVRELMQSRMRYRPAAGK